jgi:hypothetical protein
MNLGEYFDGAKGQGVLATADGSGKVNVAVYARPHFLDDETALFIMADRLSHENLSSNPWAAYIFIEAGVGVAGNHEDVHAFNRQIVMFKTVANATHNIYGTSSRPAALLTLQNAMNVPSTATSSMMISAKANPGRCRPKNSGVHSAFSAHCTRYRPRVRLCAFHPPSRHTSQAATAIIA